MSSLTNKTNDVLNTLVPKAIINVDENYIKDEILKSAKKALINSQENSNLALLPKLLVNDYSKGNKVLNELIS